MKEDLNGLCCLYVGLGRDDDVFVVGPFLVGGVALGFPNFYVLGFA